MKVLFSKIIGVLIVASAIFFYGCESSLNTGPDEVQQKQLPLVPSTSHGGLTVANDGLTVVDISGIPATDFVTAGTGTASRQAESISVEVPAGATIEAVFLYWARLDNDIDNPPQAPSTIMVNGTEFTGTVAGGPIDNPMQFLPSELKAGITHKVDLTGAGIISPGMNTFTVQDDFSNPSGEADPLGASVIVFYSEAGQESELLLFDGVDYLWANSAGDTFDQSIALQTARPVTFMFDAAAEDRTANLTLFIGDIEPEDAAERPNSLMITVGDGPTETLGPLPNPFQGFQGAQWDNFVTTITIPAGVDNVTIEPVSGPGTNPASLLWSLAGLSVPVLQDEGGQGCTPGFWRQPFNFDLWTTFDPDDVLDDAFDVPSNLMLVRPERGAAEDVQLRNAIKLRGGGVNALIRHAVAAILNAASPDVSYDLSVSEVQAMFNGAVRGGDIEGTKGTFEGFNEQGCPLSASSDDGGIDDENDKGRKDKKDKKGKKGKKGKGKRGK